MPGAVAPSTPLLHATDLLICSFLTFEYELTWWVFFQNPAVDTSDKVDIHVLILIFSYIYIAGGRHERLLTETSVVHQMQIDMQNLKSSVATLRNMKSDISNLQSQITSCKYCFVLFIIFVSNSNPQSYKQRLGQFIKSSEIFRQIHGEEFEYTKRVISTRISKKNRQHNGQKNKQRSTKHAHKSKDRIKRTH